MDLDLSGKRALVCGSSQGIGRAVAEQLAKQGARVTCLARNAEKLQQVVSQLPGEGHDFMALDLTDIDKVRLSLHEKIKESPYHIVILNAGGPKGGPIVEAESKNFREAFDIHLIASAEISKILLPGMKEAGYGRILNIISTSVKTPLPGLGVSNTIRAAVAAWAKTLSAEVAKDGVTVNSVLPGATETERLSSLLEAWAGKRGVSVEEEAQIRKSQIPAGRFGQPQEVANLAAFLASPAAGYITGTATCVDGGRTACH